MPWVSAFLRQKYPDNWPEYEGISATAALMCVMFLNFLVLAGFLSPRYPSLFVFTRATETGDANDVH
jgi:hypothetical protein